MNPQLTGTGWIPLASRTGGGEWTTGPSTLTTQAATSTARAPVDFRESVPAADSARRFYRLRAELVP